MAAVVAVVASVWLRNGVTRQIAHFDGDDATDVESLVLQGLTIRAVVSLVTVVALYHAALLAGTVLDRLTYARAFRPVAVGTLGLTPTRIATAVFRNLGRENTSSLVTYKNYLSHAGRFDGHGSRR